MALGLTCLGPNRTLRLGDPFRVAKGGDHFVPIVQDGKTSILIRAEGCFCVVLNGSPRCQDVVVFFPTS